MSGVMFNYKPAFEGFTKLQLSPSLNDNEVLLRRSGESILFLLTNILLRCCHKCWLRDSVKVESKHILIARLYKEGWQAVAASLCRVALWPWELNRLTSMQVSCPGLFISYAKLQKTTSESWKRIFLFNDKFHNLIKCKRFDTRLAFRLVSL